MIGQPTDRIVEAPRMAWRDGVVGAGRRPIPQETAIALTYNRLAYAVMMATPADLEDFAVGFSLSEGVVASANLIQELEIVPQALGVEVRMWIAAGDMGRLEDRRRSLAGPTGCGLCGLESLAATMRPVPRVSGTVRVDAGMVAGAVASLGPAQVLNRETGATHAAGYWEPGRGLIALREDVGRHNALDKLAGALARAGLQARGGILVLTSRVSVEMVQKAAAMGVSILAAISAPTGLALEVAEAAGITLVAVARPDGFEVFTHSSRILMPAPDHVA